MGYATSGMVKVVFVRFERLSKKNGRETKRELKGGEVTLSEKKLGIANVFCNVYNL